MVAHADETAKTTPHATGAPAQPDSARPPRAGRRRGLGLIVGISAVIIAAFWANALQDIASDRSRAEDEARQTTMALAQLAEAQAETALSQAENHLRLLRHHLRAGGAAFDWGSYLAEQEATRDNLHMELGYYDIAGSLVRWSGPVVKERRNIAGLDEFRRHKEQSADGLAIGLPYHNVAVDRIVIPVSLRLEDADGRFAGAVVGEVDSQAFSEFYARVNLPAGSSIALTRADGPLLARRSMSKDLIGRNFANSTIWPELARRPIGHYQAIRSTDGVERLFAYRTSMAYPTIVVLGIPTAHLFASVNEERLQRLLSAAALSLFVPLAAALLWREIRLREDEIAARRAAETAVATREAYARSILETAVDGIVTVDGEGLIRTANAAAERLFGYGPGEMAGLSISLLMPERQRDDHERRVRDHQGEGRTVMVGSERRAAGLRRDGSGFPIEVSVASWNTAEGRFFTAIVRDVTERRRMENQLIQAHDEATRANRAKSEFLAMMSHELRTPLNAIIGFSETLEVGLFGPMEAKQREYVGDIRASGEHLLSLINDILDLSKVEAGSFVLEVTDLDVAALAEDCRALVEGMATRRGVGLAIRRPDGPAILRADARAAKQMIVNLLSNAVKFTHPGGTATLSFHPREGGGMAVSVADTGIGMTPEGIAVALEPFGQVDNALTRREQGTGLGLPLVKRLIAMHDGTMTIESEPGRGTAVTLEFPAAGSGAAG